MLLMFKISHSVFSDILTLHKKNLIFDLERKLDELVVL